LKLKTSSKRKSGGRGRKKRKRFISFEFLDFLLSRKLSTQAYDKAKRATGTQAANHKVRKATQKKAKRKENQIRREENQGWSI
jgi:hypothetical protein